MKHVLIKSICILTLVFCVGCATHKPVEGASVEKASATNPDPWEGFNRSIFAFNLTVDRWFLKPVAKGYDFVMPDVAQTGVRNFFSNLGEVKNIVNDIFQWKWKQAGNDTGRLLVNSTLGVAGLFDVASPMGLEQSLGEDTGQTFGRWGFKRGPYIILPFLGPTTVRDGLGLPFDMWVLSPVAYVDDEATQTGLVVTNIVQQRVDLMALEKLASGDLYTFTRDAYLQRRSYLENDGEVEEDYEDEFGGEDF